MKRAETMKLFQKAHLLKQTAPELKNTVIAKLLGKNPDTIGTWLKFANYEEFRKHNYDVTKKYQAMKQIQKDNPMDTWIAEHELASAKRPYSKIVGVIRIDEALEALEALEAWQGTENKNI